MKKLTSLLMLGALAVGCLTGCGSNNSGESKPTASITATPEATGSITPEPTQGEPTGTPEAGGDSTGIELALVTDAGTIDDKSFNQGAWEGMKAYAEANGISYKYYQPIEISTASYIETIGLAITGGAKLVVCPGYNFEVAIHQLQDTYPDVSFILLDGQPHDEDNKDFTLKENVYSIFYAEEQAGFLAGYAAVKDGNTKLGFMGGMAVPAVIRFGYGYIQGADAAAKELGISDVEVKYHYTGSFDATPDAQGMAASWYQSGTQVIFGCGGAVGSSVMTAAEGANGKVIGVDVDQSNQSPTVITSAMKQLAKSVEDTLTAYYKGEKGGTVVTLDVKQGGVGLPLDTSKFEKFTKEDYDAVLAKLVDGTYSPVKDDAVETAAELPTEFVKVQVID